MKQRERERERGANLFATMLAPITFAIVPLRWHVALTTEEDMISLLILFALPSIKGVRVLAVPVGPLDQLEHVVADLAPDAGVEVRLALLILSTAQHN